MTGKARGLAPGLEAKLPQRDRRRVPTGSIRTVDTDQPPVESCSGNCHQIVTGLPFQKVISPIVCSHFFFLQFFVFVLLNLETFCCMSAR